MTLFALFVLGVVLGVGIGHARALGTRRSW
jgi:hypothetical protein